MKYACLGKRTKWWSTTNYDPAENRFSQLVRTLQHNPTMYDRYDVIQEYLAEGILKMVHSKSSDNPIYYLPHHAIVREQRTTTKLRAVFDASSHAKDSLSLNEGLLTGPNLNPDLLSILVKFRQHWIAIMADISKAFLQISRNAIDRDVLRFLWTMKTPMSVNDICILRMTRVPFGVSSSPFLLTATIRHHLKKIWKSISRSDKKNQWILFVTNLYVDDFISGAHTVRAALELAQTAKEIMSTAGMNLCNWSTNSDEWRNEWTHGMTTDTMKLKSKGPLKVLDLTWRTETDDFVFAHDRVGGICEKQKGNKENRTAVSCTHVWPHWLPITIHYQSEMFISVIVGKGPWMGWRAPRRTIWKMATVVYWITWCAIHSH